MVFDLEEKVETQKQPKKRHLSLPEIWGDIAELYDNMIDEEIVKIVDRYPYSYENGAGI